MALSMAPRSRRFGRLVVAGALAAAALALPACGDDDAGSGGASGPGGDVDPGARSGVGGVINNAKTTADGVEQRDAALDPSTTVSP